MVHFLYPAFVMVQFMYICHLYFHSIKVDIVVIQLLGSSSNALLGEGWCQSSTLELFQRQLGGNF